MPPSCHGVVSVQLSNAIWAPVKFPQTDTPRPSALQWRTTRDTYRPTVPLQTVNLFDNQFTGTLPDDICNVATNWPSMKEINLQNNMIGMSCEVVASVKFARRGPLAALT